MIDVYLTVAASSAEAEEGSTTSSADLLGALTSQADYVAEALGRELRLNASVPAEAEVIVTEVYAHGPEEDQTEFEITLTRVTQQLQQHMV